MRSKAALEVDVHMLPIPALIGSLKLPLLLLLLNTSIGTSSSYMKLGISSTVALYTL